MQRFGRIAKLREESAAAYDQLHEDVWPEVRAAVIAAGVCNYSIFRYKVWVFSYFELPEDLTLEAAFAAVSGCAICEQWEEKIEEFCERYGPQRLLFGSGFPDQCLGGAFLRLAQADIGAEARAAVAGGNLQRLLKEVRI